MTPTSGPPSFDRKRHQQGRTSDGDNAAGQTEQSVSPDGSPAVEDPVLPLSPTEDQQAPLQPAPPAPDNPAATTSPTNWDPPQVTLSQPANPDPQWAPPNPRSADTQLAQPTQPTNPNSQWAPPTATTPPRHGPGVGVPVTSSDGNGSGRTKSILIAGAALLGVAAIAWVLLNRGSGTEASNIAVVVSDRGSVHLLGDGDEPDRTNRAAENDAVTRILTVDGRRELAPLVDGQRILLSTANSQAVLYAWRPGQPSSEIFDSTGTISVRTNGDRLFVAERRGDTSRCFAGRPERLADSRLFRGFSCSFSNEGHLVTNEQTRDGFLVEVQALDGDILLSDEFDSEGRLNDDGSILILDGMNSFEAIRVATGEILVDLDPSAEQISRHVVEARDTVAVLTQRESGDFELELVDDVGAVRLDLEQGRATVSISENEDLYVLESAVGGPAEISQWDQESRELIVLASLPVASVVEATDQGLLVRSGTSGAQVLSLITREGETEVGDLSDRAAITLLEGNRIAVLDTFADTEAVTFYDLDSGQEVATRGWDNLSLLTHHDETLVVAAVDGDDTVPLVLDIGTSATIELETLSSGIDSAAIVGDAIFITTIDRRTETLAFDRTSGEPIVDIDLDGFRAQSTTTVPASQQRTITSSEFDRGARCVTEGLRRFSVNEQIDVDPGESVCLFADGEIVLTVAAEDDDDPRLEVDTGSTVLSNDDVDFPDDLSSRLEATVEGVAIVTAFNSGGDTTLVIVARG